VTTVPTDGGLIVPPRKRKPAGPVDTTGPTFPTWDDLVAEAHEAADMPPYQIPLPRGKVVEIPVLKGDQYLDLLRANRSGNAPAALDAMFPDPRDRATVVAAMGSADWTIVDVLSAKVLRYFYGLDVSPKKRNPEVPEEADEELGKSSGS
jgi:hypothetical protein